MINVDRADSLLLRSDSSDGLRALSASRRPPRRNRRQSPRERAIFADADAFDSIALSATPRTGTLPTIHTSPFVKYLFQDPTHKSILVNEAKAILFSQLHSANSDLLAALERHSTAKDDLRACSRSIIAHRAVGADAMRHFLRLHIALQTHRMAFYEAEAAAMRANLRACAEFSAFLDTCRGADVCVDLNSFFSECCRDIPLDRGDFFREDAILRGWIEREMAPRPREDPKVAFFLPETETGQVIRRLVKQVDDVYYADLEVIARHLIDAGGGVFTFSELIDRLFDMAWSVRSFPFACMFSFFRLPAASGIVAKVFRPAFVGEEWQLIPLGKLTNRPWPLHPAVGELFVIATLTDPFQIAGQFYRVIEEIGRCCQRILIRSNMDASFVEIDFDQMFVLMILCVLALGIPDILGPMKWSYSFADFLGVDPQKQYAMSHMEGLCEHLEHLDYSELIRQSKQLLDAKDVVGDPLGVGASL
jgi:hypothetical protein